MYASWYRQTYPDKVLAISQTSNEGLVSVDNSGTVRLWETGVANLAQSMTEWKVGSDNMFFFDRWRFLSVQVVVSSSHPNHFSVIHLF
jgi:hypothetical protein